PVRDETDYVHARRGDRHAAGAGTHGFVPVLLRGVHHEGNRDAAWRKRIPRFPDSYESHSAPARQTGKSRSELRIRTGTAGQVMEKDKKIHTYNFKRPDRISKNQIRSLHFVHDRFARNASSSISAYLRMVVEISLE